MVGKRWTDEEIEILRKNYSEGTPLKDIADKLGRSLSSVKNKTIQLKLPRNWLWSDKDINQLKQMYLDNIPFKEIADRLGRSIKATEIKASKLDLLSDGWTNEDKEILIKLYSDKTPVNDIANILNKTKSSVYNKAGKLGLTTPQKPVQPWELQHIKWQYIDGNMTLEKVAEQLGRNVKSVGEIINKHGLTKTQHGKRKNTQKIVDGKKQCSDCGGWWDLNLFNENSEKSTGYASHCKYCENKKYTKKKFEKILIERKQNKKKSKRIKNTNK